MSIPLRILILDNSKEDTRLMLRILKRAGYQPVHQRVETAETLRSALQTAQWDVIVSDYVISPGFDALTALAIFKESGIDVPFIVISEEVGAEAAIAAMKAGVHNCIWKPGFKRLVPVIERELYDARVRRGHQRALDALRVCVESYGELAELLPEAGLEAGSTGRLTSRDHGAFELSGYDRDDCRRGLNPVQMLSPDDQPKVRKNIRRKTDKPAGLQGTIADLADRTRAEEELHRREEEFRAMVENSPDIVLRIDRNMQVTYANPAIERANGIPCSTYIGATLSDLPCPASLTHIWEENARRVFESCRERTVEYEILTPMGLQWHECRLAPQFAEDGSVAFVLMVSRDITDRRRMQEELFKTKKFEAISILAGGIAHDFNNLLMVILGNINLAEISLTFPDSARKALKQAEKACSHATALVRQIVLLSQSRALFKRVQSIGHLIDDAVRVALSGSDLQLKLSVPEDLRSISCDFGQIHQALVELVINARDAMDTGGIVEVSAENVELSEDEISSLKKGKYVRVSIKDSGIGIPKEQLALIFDPYFSTKVRGTQKGMGLGLTVVYSTIKGHDGGILVESDVGVGSTFHIFLPASETMVEKPVAFERRKPARNAKVLVMDDEEMLLETVGNALAQLGHEVELAKDGHEAVELFRSASESGEAFDVVVLDLTVKGGMGGEEAIRELLDIDPSVKAILQTGYADDPILSYFRDYGFVGALRKPYSVEELNELIQNLILNKE